MKYYTFHALKMPELTWSDIKAYGYESKSGEDVCDGSK
jgi:hypothetical protein